MINKILWVHTLLSLAISPALSMNVYQICSVFVHPTVSNLKSSTGMTAWQELPLMESTKSRIHARRTSCQFCIICAETAWHRLIPRPLKAVEDHWRCHPRNDGKDYRSSWTWISNKFYDFKDSWPWLSFASIQGWDLLASRRYKACWLLIGVVHIEPLMSAVSVSISFVVYTCLHHKFHIQSYSNLC